MTPITEPEDAGVALVANLGQKVTWGEEEATEHPTKPLLEKRKLRVIDPIEDDGVWVILDSACNSTCHGRPWRENMERKVSEAFELAFFWSSRKSKPIEGIGGKKAATIVGRMSIPLCFKLELAEGVSFDPTDDFASTVIFPVGHDSRRELYNDRAYIAPGRNRPLPDWDFETYMVFSNEIDTDDIEYLLLSKEHQSKYGIRLDVVQNICQKWSFGSDHWYEMELCETVSGLPCIRIDNFWEERIARDKVARVETCPTIFQRGVTDSNPYFQVHKSEDAPDYTERWKQGYKDWKIRLPWQEPVGEYADRLVFHDHECACLQYEVVASKWHDGTPRSQRDYTQGTLRGMYNCGYPVPLDAWIRSGLSKEEYCEPDYDQVHEIEVDQRAHISFMIATGSSTERLDDRLKFDPMCNGRPKSWNKFVWSKAEKNRYYWEQDAKNKPEPQPDVENFVRSFLFDRHGPDGKSVSLLLSNCQEHEMGWKRFDYIPPKAYHLTYPEYFVEDEHGGYKLKGKHWCEAQHGTNLAALYSILALGTIRESACEEEGDTVWKSMKGAYCHGVDESVHKKDTRPKSENYCIFWSPLDDGIYYQFKLDLLVDRDKGRSASKDQWCQPHESIMITGLYCRALAVDQVPYNVRVIRGWKPEQEAHWRKVNKTSSRTDSIRSRQ